MLLMLIDVNWLFLREASFRIQNFFEKFVLSVTTYCPLMDEWIMKMWYKRKKKKENLTFVATCTDLEGIMQCKVSQRRGRVCGQIG